MPPLEARRSERVDYNAEVELLARAGARTLHRVFAHAFDLGAGGMRIAGPVDMAVGDEVTCRVTLDGRPASLPGRVAWRREPNTHEAISAHSMGICFQPLGVYESGLLQHVVERSSAGYRAVELHFSGLDQPVVARARARTNGLRLSAALPIFARNTELTFQLDEEGPLFTGRIGDATLREENGARRLDIEVDVLDDGVRFRRRARYGYANEIEAEEHLEAEQARNASLADTQPNAALARTVEIRRTSTRRGTLSLMLLATLAGGALAWFAATQLRSTPQGDGEPEFVARPRAFDDAVASALAPTPEPEQEPVTVPEAEPDRALDPGTASATPAPLPAAVPEPSLTGPAPQPASSAALPTQIGAPAHEPAAHETARPAHLSPTSEALAPAVLEDGQTRLQPKSVVEGDITRIRIPFMGTLEGMRSVVWAEPAALAIDAPAGSTSLEYGRYVVDGAGVTELRVNQSGSALLLRIRLSAPIARYSITAENGTLEVLIQRALQRAR